MLFRSLPGERLQVRADVAVGPAGQLLEVDVVREGFVAGWLVLLPRRWLKLWLYQFGRAGSPSDFPLQVRD